MQLGVRLGETAVSGTIIALYGDLGAGKTVLARGIGQGLGTSSRITSPTFVLVATHESGRLPLWHADLYRLSDPDELTQLGIDDVWGATDVCVVEWAERAGDELPQDRLDITMHHQPVGRRLTLVATGPKHQALLARLWA